MTAEVSALVDTLRSKVGDNLRAVGTYTADGYDLKYLREDIRETISEERIDHIHEDLILHGLGKQHLEGLFNAGKLHCSIHRFEDATMFHFVGKSYSGLFVSIDSDANVNLHEFTETCQQWM